MANRRRLTLRSETLRDMSSRSIIDPLKVTCPSTAQGTGCKTCWPDPP